MFHQLTRLWLSPLMIFVLLVGSVAAYFLGYLPQLEPVMERVLPG